MDYQNGLPLWTVKWTTVQPRYNDPQYNDIPDITHPRKPRASTGTGREGRDWEREKGGGRVGEGKGEALGSFSIQIISRSITVNTRR